MNPQGAAVSSVPTLGGLLMMTIVTFSNEPHGLGLTYDDVRLACVNDLSDSRLRAAWSSRTDSKIAASALFTLPGCSADQIASGTASQARACCSKLAQPGCSRRGGSMRRRASRLRFWPDEGVAAVVALLLEICEVVLPLGHRNT